MKVLFVDDEPLILQGIERTLFHLDWDVTCVETGAEALEALRDAGDEPFDVIVSDMRMPGMDGATLLRHVHDDYPGVVRIVLSGYAELEAAMRAVPVAHQFLSKPCKAELLESVVGRACSLQALLSDEHVRAVVGRMDNLPSVPRIYAQLTRALADENTDAKAVGKIVAQDPAMCAKLLQLVNSSFFGRAVAIVDISEAVVRLGFSMIKSLVISAEVFQSTKLDRTFDGFSVDGLQRHSLEVATLASRVVPERGASGDALMAGMLHDVGKLILAVELPEMLAESLALANAEDKPIHLAEMDVMGVSHTEIGAYLLGLWGLPYPLVEAIAHHHEPSRVETHSEFGVLEGLHVANCLVLGDEIDAEVLGRGGGAPAMAKWKKQAASVLRG